MFLEEEELEREQPRVVALPVTPADPGQASLASVPHSLLGLGPCILEVLK